MSARWILALLIGLLALSMGAMLAWVSVEWPSPLPLVPRVIGWVFWVSLCAAGGVAGWKASS